MEDRFKTQLANNAEQLAELSTRREALEVDVQTLRTEALPPLEPLKEEQKALKAICEKLEEGHVWGGWGLLGGWGLFFWRDFCCWLLFFLWGWRIKRRA